MPLINCEVSLSLTWSEKFVLTSKETKDATHGVDAVNNPTNATLKIKDTKLYVQVITLSTENDNKILEQLKAGLKKKQLNGTNIDQKCLIRLQITT